LGEGIAVVPDSIDSRIQPLLSMREKIKIIDSFWVFLVATAVLGPFALPILWRNPRYTKKTKIAATFKLIGFTVLLLYAFNLLMSEMTAFLESQSS